MTRDFNSLFSVKNPVIGMLHLSGENKAERVERALREVKIFEREGVDGAIVEDYHGTYDDVQATLRALHDRGSSLVLGVNVLRNPYIGFELARRYGAGFVQFDSVQPNHLDIEKYSGLREEYGEVSVLGGVRFKGKEESPNNLDSDLSFAKESCEAVVTTGESTGRETPLEKLT